MYAELDSFDLVRLEIVLVAELDAGIDRRMHRNPAGKRFVGVEGGFPGFAKVFCDLGVIAFRAQGIGPTEFAFESLFGTGEVFRGEQCGRESVLRGSARMKTLGHRPEHFSQPHGLHGGEPDGPEHLLFCQPRRRPAAAAAPNTPVVPVICQPAS